MMQLLKSFVKKNKKTRDNNW